MPTRASAVVRVLPDRWVPCPLDQIACVVNPVQQMDLSVILSMTPPGRGLAVAMAYAGITSCIQLLVLAQLMAPQPSARRSNHMSVSMSRWMRGVSRMPLGIAYRIAAVFGVPVELLFSRETRGGVR